MYCIRCGKENNDNSNYCINCGNKLEVNKYNISKEDTIKKDNLGYTNLSIASLICLIVRFFSTFIGIVLSSRWIIEIPWLLVSLVLSIISRVKYKDKMSKVLLIVDIVLMVIELILFIILIIIVIFFISDIIGKWGNSEIIDRIKQIA